MMISDMYLVFSPTVSFFVVVVCFWLYYSSFSFLVFFVSLMLLLNFFFYYLSSPLCFQNLNYENVFFFRFSEFMYENNHFFRLAYYSIINHIDLWIWGVCVDDVQIMFTIFLMDFEWIFFFLNFKSLNQYWVMDEQGRWMNAKKQKQQQIII